MPDFLLLQNGDNLLLQTGDNLLLQSETATGVDLSWWAWSQFGEPHCHV